MPSFDGLLGLLRTHRPGSPGSWPTMTTARPGVMPCSALRRCNMRMAMRVLTCLRRRLFPSMMVASMSSAPARVVRTYGGGGPCGCGHQAIALPGIRMRFPYADSSRTDPVLVAFGATFAPLAAKDKADFDGRTEDEIFRQAFAETCVYSPGSTSIPAAPRSASRSSSSPSSATGKRRARNRHRRAGSSASQGLP
jgi:hypothetical protein